MVKYLREREVDEVLFGPGVGAVVGKRVLQSTNARGGRRRRREVDLGTRLLRRGHAAREVVAHVVDEVREDDARLTHGQVARPTGDPLEGHIAVVARGAQRVEHLVQRQVAFAHHAVLEVPVNHHRVLHLAVAQVAAQILDGGLRRLTHQTIRVVQVPHGADAVHIHGVEHATQPGRVRVLGRGLNQHCDVVDGGNLAELLEQLHHVLVVDHADGMDVAREQHADVRGAHVAGQLDVAHDLVDVVLATAVVGKLAVGREARNLEADALELLARTVATVGMEGRGARRKRAALDTTDLDAVKAQVLCHGIDVEPRVRRTANSREGKLHDGVPLV